jgi:hypothetical protein
MKVITPAQGMVVLRYSPDDTMPDRTVMMKDLVSFVGDAYNFSTKPQVPAAPIIEPLLNFQSGELLADGDKYPITAIVLTVGGSVVIARNTDDADFIADDLIGKLDTQLGYKIRANLKSRDYQSTLVVEFDPSLEQQISAFARAEEIINREIPRPSSPFKTKRLAFGYGDIGIALNRPFSLDDIPNSDFTIDRRAGESYDRNRYYAAAPLRTSEHARVLALVEEAMRS